jgi:hypothetical protein
MGVEASQGVDWISYKWAERKNELKSAYRTHPVHCTHIPCVCIDQQKPHSTMQVYAPIDMTLTA